MAKGRPPKPVEQRRLEGGEAVSHRPMPEPLLVAGRPDLNRFRDPPAHLPAAAKEFWQDSITRLAEVGIIDLVDTPALEMLAIQYARARQAGRVIAEEGHYALGSKGQIKEHPALKIERDAHAMFMRLATEFAMTPIARTRLGLAELHRRAMGAEMDASLSDGAVDGEVVEDADLAGGLPT